MQKYEWIFLYELLHSLFLRHRESYEMLTLLILDN